MYVDWLMLLACCRFGPSYYDDFFGWRKLLSKDDAKTVTANAEAERGSHGGGGHGFGGHGGWGGGDGGRFGPGEFKGQKCRTRTEQCCLEKSEQQLCHLRLSKFLLLVILLVLKRPVQYDILY